MCMLSASISIRAISKDAVSPPVALPLKRSSCTASQQQEGSSEPFQCRSIPASSVGRQKLPSHPTSLWKCISQEHSPRVSAQQQGRRRGSKGWERQSLSEPLKGHRTFQNCPPSTAPHVRFNSRNDLDCFLTDVEDTKSQHKTWGMISMCRTRFIFYSSPYLATLFSFMELSRVWITQSDFLQTKSDQIFFFSWKVFFSSFLFNHSKHTVSLRGFF